jgi:hypothetical protein
MVISYLLEADPMVGAPDDALSVMRDDSICLSLIETTLSFPKLTGKSGTCRWGFPNSLGKYLRTIGLRDTKQAQIIDMSISAILKDASVDFCLLGSIDLPP